eukprot:CAMPEP_0119405772 /NCGR_PEP_ID=MMETSP1335-20130426/348_1 /TAXON_ID=259385 /ORGANISM="Chrysoculter rhomboideus, Strain RCC1486" /LENGTH=65 /DNA_ID=CAMNT_0007429815 /DNA_START=157 /DNA_END=354 /DNA_ORIENTATION=-
MQRRTKPPVSHHAHEATRPSSCVWFLYHDHRKVGTTCDHNLLLARAHSNHLQLGAGLDELFCTSM